MKINKYSFGLGDRFGLQGKAQLKAIIKAQSFSVDIIPVWNKSYREHQTIHTNHQSVRAEADETVTLLEWLHPYFVDADHINLKNVDGFINYSDFFTIDVADYIDEKSADTNISDFVKFNLPYIGQLKIPGIEIPFTITEEYVWHIGEKFLAAASEASRIYQYIINKKGKQHFIPEISIDEVEDPHSPEELFFILSALRFYEVYPQTIAPKFTGRFNKGVDYIGDLSIFEQEFEQDLLIVDTAIKVFNMPENLKLSVHSGSDKFSIYKPISKLIRKYNKGIHLKTAGTTWLEELAGLALSDGAGLRMSKAIYNKAFDRFEELTGPYSSVIDIDKDKLPDPALVDTWDVKKFVGTLRHVPTNPDFNNDFRQILHVAYKIAAEYGDEFLRMIKKNEKFIGPLVTENLFDNHIKPIFID